MLSYPMREAFGHAIQSDFDLPMLQASPAAEPDILVRRNEGLPRIAGNGDPFFDITPDRQYFHWNAVGSFEITDRATILAGPYDGTTDALVSQPLLGIVISVLLARRRLLCLHGGAVAVEGGAAIFLGHKGAGKSTTVGALLAAGCQLLTDDLAAIEILPGREQPTLQPGVASLKLWPDSVEALSVDTTTSSMRVHPAIPKVQKDLGAAILAGPTPVRALFFLDRSPVNRTSAIPLTSDAALRGLIEHASVSRFGADKMGREHMAWFIDAIAKLIACTKIYRLEMRTDISAISDVAETVLEATVT